MKSLNTALRASAHRALAWVAALRRLPWLLRSALALLVCLSPMAWAVTIGGVAITATPLLKFDQALIERRADAGPFTQAAVASYSTGAIRYSSTRPDVATVDPRTGAVTPVSVGETRIRATQQAAAPFPEVTAEYTARLTGTAVVFQPWVLPNKVFGAANSYVIGTGPGQLPPAQSNSDARITYRSLTPDIASVATDASNVTTVTVLKAGTASLVAEQAATRVFDAGSSGPTPFVIQSAPATLTWSDQVVRVGQTLSLSPPLSPNPGGAFTYSVAGAFATVTGSTLTGVSAGVTTITAHQAASGNYAAGSITQTLSVLPAVVDMGAIDVPYGTPQFALPTSVSGVNGAITAYALTAGNPVADLNGFTVLTKAVGSTGFTAYQNGVEMARGTLRVVKAAPTITFQIPGKTVHDKPFELMATSTNAVTPIRYEVTGGNAAAVRLMGDRGQTVWIVSGDTTVQITAKQDGNANTEAAQATATLSIGSGQPWVEVVQGLPDRVLNDQVYELKVRTNAPQPWGFLLRHAVYLSADFAQVLGVTRQGDGIDVYQLKFTNHMTGQDERFGAQLQPRDPWGAPGFAAPNFSTDVVPLNDVTLAWTSAVPSTYAWAPYEFTWGVDPPLASRQIPPQILVDMASFNNAVASFDGAGPGAPALIVTGAGQFTLKGWIDGHPVQTTVTVHPQATTLTGPAGYTLSMDTARLEVYAPVSSRPGPASYTYTLGNGTTADAIARLEVDGDHTYLVPLAVGSTSLHIVQPASGNFAQGDLTVPVTVTAGAILPGDLPAAIERTYGDASLSFTLSSAFDLAQPLQFDFNDTTPNVLGAVASAQLVNNRLQLAFTHAGVTTLTVRQGSTTATTTITVHKAQPRLGYTSSSAFLVQQRMCLMDTSPLYFPLLNQGQRAPMPGLAVHTAAALYSLSDGAVTYAVPTAAALSFRAADPYDLGTLSGVYYGGSNGGVPGTLHSLQIQQAGTPDFLPDSLTVPDAIQIRGFDANFVPSCPA
jgi:hypothetical protein